MRFFKSLIPACLILSLGGCVNNNLETTAHQRTIPVSKTSYLTLDQSWPQATGVYLQRIKTTVQGKPFTFSVHITLEKEKMEAIAFSDIFGRLYHLTWTPENISWEASEHIPDLLKPDYIIADFLLTYLPTEQLRAALKGAQVRENGDSQDNMREIENNGEVYRRIYRRKPLGDLWEKVTIMNPEWKYELEIETVRLQ